MTATSRKSPADWRRPNRKRHLHPLPGEGANGLTLLRVIRVFSEWQSVKDGDWVIGEEEHHHPEAVYVSASLNFKTITPQNQAALTDTLEELCRSRQTPFIFFEWNVNFPFELCLELRRRGLILISGDEMAVNPAAVFRFPLLIKYDSSISYYPRADAHLRRLGIHPISYGVSLNYFGPYTAKPPASLREVEVMFVGTAGGSLNTRSRILILNQLRGLGVKVSCWGGGFASCGELFGGELPGVKVDMANGRVNNVVAAYQNAKIGLNFDLIHKDRTFQIVLAGALLVSLDTDQMREYFVPGKEMVVFSTVEDLAEKIKYYLAHDGERLAIAQRAYDKAMRRWPYHKVFNRAFSRFITQMARRDQDPTDRLFAACLTAVLVEAPDRDPALAGLRRIVKDIPPGRIKNLSLATFVGLPDTSKDQAYLMAENMLVSLGTAKDAKLAAVFASICVGATMTSGNIQFFEDAAEIFASLGLDADAAPCRDAAKAAEAVYVHFPAQCFWGSGIHDLDRRLKDVDRPALFGAGGLGRTWLKFFRTRFPDKDYVLFDNNQKLWGSLVDGVRVHPPADLKKINPGFVFIASTPGLESIQERLKWEGLTPSRDFLALISLPPKSEKEL